MEKKFWHICTDGLAKGIIFTSDEDYVFGMNGIPVYSLKYDISILAFCLMSNHVHFIVQGEFEKCRQFIRTYKRRLSLIADVRNVEESIKEISDTDYLKRAICYVLRNPTAARISIFPTHYRWSSGSLYFNDSSKPGPQTSLLSETVSARAKRILLHTRASVPEHFRITEDGMICPECYVAYSFVEKIFKSPLRFLYFLSKNDNMEVELSGDILHKARYTDNEIAGSVREICINYFYKSTPEELCVEDRYRLAAILRKRYGIGIKQIARLTGTDSKLLKEIL